MARHSFKGDFRIGHRRDWVDKIVSGSPSRKVYFDRGFVSRVRKKDWIDRVVEGSPRKSSEAAVFKRDRFDVIISGTPRQRNEKVYTPGDWVDRMIAGEKKRVEYPSSTPSQITPTYVSQETRDRVPDTALDDRPGFAGAAVGLGGRSVGFLAKAFIKSPRYLSGKYQQYKYNREQSRLQREADISSYHARLVAEREAEARKAKLLSAVQQRYGGKMQEASATYKARPFGLEVPKFNRPVIRWPKLNVSRLATPDGEPGK